MATTRRTAPVAPARRLAGCAGPANHTPAPGAGPAPAGEAPRSTGPKRITVGITAEPPSLYYPLIPAPIRAVPGAIEEFVHPGLVVFDNYGVLHPLFVEAVPSIENRLWKVLPDGRMETTWRLKPEARWQDGAPITS